MIVNEILLLMAQESDELRQFLDKRPETRHHSNNKTHTLASPDSMMLKIVMKIPGLKFI